MTKKNISSIKSDSVCDDRYQVVFEKDNSYISPHLYERNDGYWKSFKGRKRIGTFDKTLKIRTGE